MITNETIAIMEQDETAIMDAYFSLCTPVFGLQLCCPRLHKLVQAVKPDLVKEPVMQCGESAWVLLICMSRTMSKVCLSDGMPDGQKVHGMIISLLGSWIEVS